MANEYLTFTLGNTMYAASVSQVLEVLEYKEPQELPCPDPVIAGIIRSRGKSISVINLHVKFELGDEDNAGKEKKAGTAAEYRDDRRIIVFEIPDKDTGAMNYFGALTDTVLEVIGIDDTNLEPPPEVGNSAAARFISGIGQKDGRFILIIDFAKVFTFDELHTIAALAEKE